MVKYENIITFVIYADDTTLTNIKTEYKLQKRAVRIITRSQYLSNTDPTFKTPEGH